MNPPCPPAQDNDDSYTYAERIHGRLPRGVQEHREPMQLSNFHPGSCEWP